MSSGINNSTVTIGNSYESTCVKKFGSEFFFEINFEQPEKARSDTSRRFTGLEFFEFFRNLLDLLSRMYQRFSAAPMRTKLHRT